MADTYTPLNGFVKISDLSIASDEKTMSGKCLETKSDMIKVDDIVYFLKGNEIILRVDNEEQAFIDEKYIVLVKT